MPDPNRWQESSLISTQKRSQVKIAEDILQIALNDTTKTQIVYRANLNFRMLDKYLTLLLDKGLIAAASSSVKRYKTTEKGKEFLHYSMKAREFL